MQRFFIIIVFSYFFVCITTSAPTENCTVAGTCDNPESTKKNLKCKLNSINFTALEIVDADQRAARIKELNTFDNSGRTPLMVDISRNFYHVNLLCMYVCINE